jgi:hypothetical protein
MKKGQRMTYPVWRLLKKANTMLDKQKCPKLTRDNRQTVASMIESVLMDTENYEGFSYRDLHDVDPGCLAGQCEGRVVVSGTRCTGDETSRCYQMNGELRAQQEKDDGERV